MSAVFARRIAGTVLALSLLTACGGGSAGSPVVPPASHTAAVGHVQFTMHWPGKSDLAKLKHPLFISPSTMSMGIEVYQGSNSTTAYSTTIVNNPSKSGQGTISNVSIDAPAGSDTIYISLYQAQNAQGNELGQAEVTTTIVAAKTNTVGITVQGMLAKIGVAPLPNQPLIEQTPDSTGATTFKIVGDQPVKVAITPMDAAGNVIVAPGTVPTISLTSSDPSFAVSGVSGKPNEYTVQAVAPTASGNNPALVAKGTDGLGDTAQTEYSCSEVAAFYVGFENSGAGSISLIDQAGKVYTTAGFSGVVDPKAIAYDGDDHRLFVADAASNHVLAFNTDGSAAQGYTTISFPGAAALAYDSTTKHLFVTGPSATAVGVYTASGSAVSVSGTWPSLAQPNAIAIGTPSGSSETVFVTSATAGVNPQEFSTAGNNTGSLSQDPTVTSTGIAFDPTTSDIWVTSTGGSGPQLTAYFPFGFSVQNVNLPASSIPGAMTFNPLNDEFYIVDRDTNSILAYTNQDPSTQAGSVPFTNLSMTNPTGLAIVP